MNLIITFLGVSIVWVITSLVSCMKSTYNKLFLTGSSIVKVLSLIGIVLIIIIAMIKMY